jgi:hypothetical protein
MVVRPLDSDQHWLYQPMFNALLNVCVLVYTAHFLIFLTLVVFLCSTCLLLIPSMKFKFKIQPFSFLDIPFIYIYFLSMVFKNMSFNMLTCQYHYLYLPWIFEVIAFVGTWCHSFLPFNSQISFN